MKLKGFYLTESTARAGGGSFVYSAACRKQLKPCNLRVMQRHCEPSREDLVLKSNYTLEVSHMMLLSVVCVFLWR